ncbi:tannase/feruloyl esterase family alpha/beta hydrolase [Telmatospirillum sp.]|uniref:tannase/feruloyl esterase family alpha/beta hydrolase n=1 Tax=Telmatospirillum sp. TaxID=2079197 RepID=UPI00284C1E62|nr:tannase/feruloyl esterase family alpha/beta hydrolase [Telmatospirillum sp.]MDR3439436.1 tannase/feruloyl esterase family alpha/beta hydrolase [Telmatospirillum sp.]
MTHDAAAALIQAYYGTAPQHSYFVGCSDGGREGLMMAKRFPTYFDGIVAGAAAKSVTHLWITNVRWEQLFSNAANVIPVSKIATIQNASTAACANPASGLVENPLQCNWDPSSLLCTGADATNCLTASQVAAVKTIMKGTFNPRTGKMIFPGYNMFSGLSGYIVTSPPLAGGQSGANALGAMAYQNTNWDWQNFNFDSDVDKIEATPIGAAVVLPEDLAAYKARGGKVLLYHGWEDPGISPYDTVNFYERMIRVNATAADGRVLDLSYQNPEFPYNQNTANSSLSPRAQALAAQAMKGAYARSLATTEQFARLYMVPGVNHCSGGPGPQSFTDATRQYGELVQALETWVENGVAPETIVVSKHAGDVSTAAVLFTHPLCTYPKVATYVGSGSTTSANNWVCK